MSEEERAQALAKFEHSYEDFSLAQVQELWSRRDELDKKLFHLMINSVLGEYDGRRTEPKYPNTCPFTGSKADATVSGWWPSWLDECAIDIHSSIAKDLVDLAQRVGAGVESLTVRNEDEVLFDWGISSQDPHDEEFVNNIGALNGIKTFAELDTYEREAILTDEAKGLIRSAVNEVLKASPDKHSAFRVIHNEIKVLVKQ